MNIITLPTSACKRGEPLDIFYHNLVDFRYNKGVEIAVTVQDGSVILDGSFDLTITEIELILANGGEIAQMLSAIRCTDFGLFGPKLVPNTLPKWHNPITGTAKTFEEWLSWTYDAWWNLAGEVLFFTNVVGDSMDLYLTGTQIKILADYTENNHLTLAEAQALIVNPSWHKFE
jgi:hypothetical protein